MIKLRLVATALAAALSVTSWGLSAGPGLALEKPVPLPGIKQNCLTKKQTFFGFLTLDARGVSCSKANDILSQVMHGSSESWEQQGELTGPDGFTCKVTAGIPDKTPWKGSCRKGPKKIWWGWDY